MWPLTGGRTHGLLQTPSVFVPVGSGSVSLRHGCDKSQPRLQLYADSQESFSKNPSESLNVGATLRTRDLPPDSELLADLNCLIPTIKQGWELKHDYDSPSFTSLSLCLHSSGVTYNDTERWMMVSTIQ